MAHRTSGCWGWRESIVSVRCQTNSQAGISVCEICNYLLKLSFTYDGKLYDFNTNPPVFQTAAANSLAAIYIAQMALLLALFITFYLIARHARRLMRMESRLFMFISTLAGSFTGNFAGYMVFASSIIYIPFLSHGSLTLAQTFQQPILGELLFSSITGSWLLTALVALGGFFVGGMQQQTEKSGYE